MQTARKVFFFKKKKKPKKNNVKFQKCWPTWEIFTASASQKCARLVIIIHEILDVEYESVCASVGVSVSVCFWVKCETGRVNTLKVLKMLLLAKDFDYEIAART